MKKISYIEYVVQTLPQLS